MKVDLFNQSQLEVILLILTDLPEWVRWSSELRLVIFCGNGEASRRSDAPIGSFGRRIRGFPAIEVTEIMSDPCARRESAPFLGL